MKIERFITPPTDLRTGQPVTARDHPPKPVSLAAEAEAMDAKLASLTRQGSLSAADERFCEAALLLRWADDLAAAKKSGDPAQVEAAEALMPAFDQAGREWVDR